MVFNFLKHDKHKDLPSEWSDIFLEKTHVLKRRPIVQNLEQNLLLCDHCHETLDISEVEGLSLQPCPYCNSLNFMPKKIKNFWLYRPLGGGGMGSVYQGMFDRKSDINVAIKVLPREKRDDQTLIKALLKEAKVGYSFGKHPHLTQIFDYGHANGEYFEASELIEGIRLDEILDSGVRRPQKQIVLWALQILKAEQHILNCGYLFRDLKPQNLMIDGSGNIKLFDYGLCLSVHAAKHLDSDEISGSFHYAPPERIIGAGESQQSEIYSLGMVMYHLLTMETYFSAEEVKELANKHVAQLRISNLKIKMPAGTNPTLISLVEKMTRRLPQNRYQSYKEVAKELMAIYNNL